MSSTSQTAGPRQGRPAIAAVVALTLLEVIRSQDRPEEILQDEDPTITMPRRLGLSDVIDTQIRRYGEAARRRQRVTESEIGDLFALVVRRPDSREVFFEAGRSLTGKLPRRRRAGRLKGRLARASAKRRVRKRLKTLFGQPVGSFGQGPFVLEGKDLMFARTTPRGEACELISGLCQGIADGYDSGPVLLVHNACQAQGDPGCRWALSFGHGDETPEREEGAGAASPV